MVAMSATFHRRSPLSTLRSSALANGKREQRSNTVFGGIMGYKQARSAESKDLPFIKPKERDRAGANAPTPEEGIRLIKAFHRIKNASLRKDIIIFIEKLSEAGELQASLCAFFD